MICSKLYCLSAISKVNLKSRSINIGVNQTGKLREALLDSLKNNPGKKQVIQLNGKSSLLFANLPALTLASGGGGGGGGSSTPAAPTPTSSFSLSYQSFDFTEDTASSFSIISSGEVSDSFTITVDSICLLYTSPSPRDRG